MNRLRRFFNQNRKVIIRLTIIIVSAFLLLQLANLLVANKNDVVEQKTQEQITIEQNLAQDKNIISKKSSVTGDTISTERLKSETDIIKEFMDNCNEGEIEKAYNLLSDDCKELLYPTIDRFKEDYYEKVFNNQQKIYTIENWVNSIYKINISANILATGNINEAPIQDNITIEKNENGEQKLNINNFIKKREPNKQAQLQEVNFKVLTEEQYMDYAIYTIEVTNSSDNNILLDNLKQADSMYIEDENGIKYSAYTNNIPESGLFVNSHHKRTLKIKYFEKYDSSRLINSVVFSKIILNYEGDRNYETTGIKINI